MKLGLGTVQFGLNYGISNEKGQTPLQEVRDILVEAQGRGIRVLDTAALYGASEQVLGEALDNFNEEAGFSIVTKTSKCQKAVVEQDDVELLNTTFHQSLAHLKRKSVYGLLMHQAKDLLIPGGDRLYHALLELKAKGMVQNVGVSIYSVEELEETLERYSIDLIQLPLNVLDQRLIEQGTLAHIKRQGIEIHVRSAFLQGLLLMPVHRIPSYFDNIRPLLKAYHADLEEQGATLVQGAFSFIASLPEVDNIICGVNDVHQLKELIKAAQSPAVQIDYRKYSVKDVSILNPALWKV